MKLPKNKQIITSTLCNISINKKINIPFMDRLHHIVLAFRHYLTFRYSVQINLIP